MGLVDPQRALKHCVRDALDRGVLFDTGHGYGAFSFEVAEAIRAQAASPHIISSDPHQLSARGPMFDLPACMSKFLALGMPLADVVLAATAAPALAIGRADEAGSLQVGRRADLSLFELTAGEFTLYDVDLAARPAVPAAEHADSGRGNTAAPGGARARPALGRANDERGPDRGRPGGGPPGAAGHPGRLGQRVRAEAHAFGPAGPVPAVIPRDRSPRSGQA